MAVSHSTDPSQFPEGGIRDHHFRSFQFPHGGDLERDLQLYASVTQMDFLKSFWYSLVISVMSVVLILICCSMSAWYIVRVNGKLSKTFYYLCVFSMVVPFQMVMFTLAKNSGHAEAE